MSIILEFLLGLLIFLLIFSFGMFSFSAILECSGLFKYDSAESLRRRKQEHSTGEYEYFLYHKWYGWRVGKKKKQDR